MRNFSISTFFSLGWRAAKGEMVVLIGLYLLYMLISAIILTFTMGAELLNSILSNEQMVTGLYHSRGVTSIILQVVGLLVNVIFSLGMVRIALSLTQGKSPDFKAFTQTLPYILDYVIASIIYFIIVVVGFFLLFLPGWIWMLRFGMYSYFIIDQNCGAVESLKRSWRATKGYTINLSLMYLSSILIIIVGCMVFVVGLLVAIPVIYLSWAFVYRFLNPVKQELEPKRQATPKAPSPITSFMPEGLADEPAAPTAMQGNDTPKEDPSRFMPQ